MGDETNDKLADAISLLNANMIATSSEKTVKNPFFMIETIIALATPFIGIALMYADYSVRLDRLERDIHRFEETKTTVCNRMNVLDSTMNTMRSDLKDINTMTSQHSIQATKRFINLEKKVNK